jgi:hypothetical protein
MTTQSELKRLAAQEELAFGLLRSASNAEKPKYLERLLQINLKRVRILRLIAETVEKAG